MFSSVYDRKDRNFKKDSRHNLYLAPYLPTPTAVASSKAICVKMGKKVGPRPE